MQKDADIVREGSTCSTELEAHLVHMCGCMCCCCTHFTDHAHDPSRDYTASSAATCVLSEVDSALVESGHVIIMDTTCFGLD